MAQSKVYVASETTIWFVPAAATQAEDAVFEVDGLASGAGHQSAQFELGTSPRARKYIWRAWVKFQTTPVLGESVLVYLKTSDGAHPDNDDGTGDGAVSAINKLANLKYLGAIVVDEAATGVEMVASSDEPIDVSARHVQAVFWNATADQLSTGVNDSGFWLQPVPDAIQEAA